MAALKAYNDESDLSLTSYHPVLRNTFQRTLKTPVLASGTGLHNGHKVHISLLPAPADHGIVFKRKDLPGCPEVAAKWKYVGETMLSTTLIHEGVRVATVEHLMSALAGLGVDNAIIELDKDEVPIMDGSANSFVFLIKSAGIVEQDAGRSFVCIQKTVRVGDEFSWIEIAPYDGFRVDFKLVFEHPVMRSVQNSASVDFVNSSYIKEVSRARTFGFLDQVDKLRARGFARGGSLDNSVVLDRDRVLNRYGLRYREEFVLHKILDAVGDLYLLGGPMMGQVRAYRSGHRLNNMLLHELCRQQAYKRVFLDGRTQSKNERDLAATDARVALGV